MKKRTYHITMAILGYMLVGLVSLFIGWLCLFIQISVPYRPV